MNFFGLSLDKTDHVIQNWMIVIWGYPPSNLISIAWFYFDGRKSKKQANVQAYLLIIIIIITGCGKIKSLFAIICTKEHKKIHKIWRNKLSAFAMKNQPGPVFRKLINLNQD